MTVSASKMQFCKLAPGVLSLKIKKHFEMKPLKILSGLIKWKERFLITGKVFKNCVKFLLKLYTNMLCKSKN